MRDGALGPTEFQQETSLKEIGFEINDQRLALSFIAIVDWKNGTVFAEGIVICGGFVVGVCFPPLLL